MLSILSPLRLSHLGKPHPMHLFLSDLKNNLNALVHTVSLFQDATEVSILLWQMLIIHQINPEFLKTLFPMRYWVWHVSSSAVWWLQCCFVTSELAQRSIRFKLDIHFTWWLFSLSGPDTKNQCPVPQVHATNNYLISTNSHNVYCCPHNAYWMISISLPL